MRPVLFIPLVVLILYACNAGSKKKDPGMAGEYKRGTSSVSITKQGEKIGVSVCFANKTCIEPCFTGSLSKAGGKRFSGWVYPETPDSASEKQLVVLNFFKNEVDVLFTQKNRNWLGISCDPGGVYKKEE
ncbi:MAG TPA: hypothetical protein VGO58_07505 [Chitinophagaceae bacterium]|jgi:hypothetical protein|nr:hypothetical protein [Chitinophagaceae bacterium]